MPNIVASHFMPICQKMEENNKGGGTELWVLYLLLFILPYSENSSCPTRLLSFGLRIKLIPGM